MVCFLRARANRYSICMTNWQGFIKKRRRVVSGQHVFIESSARLLRREDEVVHLDYIAKRPHSHESRELSHFLSDDAPVAITERNEPIESAHDAMDDVDASRAEFGGVASIEVEEAATRWGLAATSSLRSSSVSVMGREDAVALSVAVCDASPIATSRCGDDGEFCCAASVAFNSVNYAQITGGWYNLLVGFCSVNASGTTICGGSAPYGPIGRQSFPNDASQIVYSSGDLRSSWSEAEGISLATNQSIAPFGLMQQQPSQVTVPTPAPTPTPPCNETCRCNNAVLPAATPMEGQAAIKPQNCPL